MITSGKFALYLMLSFASGIFFCSLKPPPLLFLFFILILGAFWIVFSLFFKKQKPSFYLTVFLLGLSLMVFALAGIRTSSAPPETTIRFSFLQNIKTNLEETIEKILPAPENSLLCGLLFGNTTKIPFWLKENLNKSGVRHITAVSGMHIVILTGLLSAFLLNSGLGRNNVFYIVFGFLWFFIFFIGAPPSALRAGLTSSALLFCQKIGRANSGPRGLLLALCLMLLFNPLFIKNIGFQLSFAAAFGITFLSRTIESKLNNKIFSFFKTKSLLAVALAAQIFTLPLLIYHFGTMSLVSPLTNILIVPLLPYLMVLGFALVAANLIFSPLSYIFLFPTYLLINLIIKAINFFAALPFSQVAFNFHWFWLFIIYSGLAVAIWRKKQVCFAADL